MEPGRAVALLRETVPAEHRDFLQTFADTFRIGDYLFVHAGVRPGVRSPNKASRTCAGSGSRSWTSSDRHGFIVVHGHTICEEVDVRAQPHRARYGRLSDQGPDRHGPRGTGTMVLPNRVRRMVRDAATSGAATGGDPELGMVKFRCGCIPERSVAVNNRLASVGGVQALADRDGRGCRRGSLAGCADSPGRARSPMMSRPSAHPIRRPSPRSRPTTRSRRSIS